MRLEDPGSCVFALPRHWAGFIVRKAMAAPFLLEWIMTKEQEDYPYAVHLNEYYSALERIDVPSLVAACTDRWYNQTLCRVNDSVVRLGVMEGEYHWHKHEDEDEFFYVVEGKFIIDLEGRTVELGPGQ